MGFLDKSGLTYLWGKIVGRLDLKVDKVTGKGLSENDYTTAEKTKLAGVAAGATANVVENVLTSTSTTNALSAAQGKALSDMVTAFVGDGEKYTPKTVDLNTLIENGISMVTASSPNNPQGVNGFVWVNRFDASEESSRITQFYYTAYNNYFAMRFYNGSTWTAWEKFVSVPKQITYHVDNKAQVDSNVLYSGGFSASCEFLNVSIDTNDIIVLYDFYNGRAIFRFYSTTMQPVYVTGNLKVLYRV